MADRLLYSLENINLSFGGKPLFEDLTLHISEGDKICLVGRNGAGKTTLMRLITGDLDQDSGKRFSLPNTTIGYLAQKLEYDNDQTVRDYILSALPKAQRDEDRSHQAEIVMAPLDLNGDALMGTLSGGQVRRAGLARALLEAPDLLLLDEPTNHLDLTAIEWLEQYLNAYQGALLCVSHDRTFLANISRKVFWIDRGAIRTCPKSYAEFDDWAEAIMEQEARELHNMQKKLAAEVDWTQGGVTGRRKRNMRRMRELHRLREKIKADKASYLNATRKIEADPLEIVTANKRIAEFKHVFKSFGTKPILKDFTMQILRGDRIGILGKNGSGKSTFLKLLIDEMEPDQGRIHRSKSIDISYFDQHRSDLDPKKTLWETLCPNGGDYVYLGGVEKRARHVCGYLKDFLFDPKAARDRVGTLSGGQQNRLLLAKILSNPGNVLILDEPTNDLDMDTLDMLQGIIAEYPGTLIIVSHDRDFLDRTVTEVLAFEGDAKVESHFGGYSDYLEAKLKAEGKYKPKKVPATATASVTSPPPQKAASNRMSYKFIHELEKLPEKIAGLEEEINDLGLTLSDPALYMSKPEMFDAASKRLAKAKVELEKSEARWLELEEMRAASES